MAECTTVDAEGRKLAFLTISAYNIAESHRPWNSVSYILSRDFQSFLQKRFEEEDKDALRAALYGGEDKMEFKNPQHQRACDFFPWLRWLLSLSSIFWSSAKIYSSPSNTENVCL